MSHTSEGVAVEPEWGSLDELEEHFDLHGEALGLRTAEQYERSSKETIDVGTFFTYRDRSTAEPRLGYFDRLAGRFTAVTEDGEEIVTHFRCREGYVTSLPEHDYR